MRVFAAAVIAFVFLHTNVGIQLSTSGPIISVVDNFTNVVDHNIPDGGYSLDFIGGFLLDIIGGAVRIHMKS